MMRQTGRKSEVGEGQIPLVNYGLAQRLKKLGFNVPCWWWYYKNSGINDNVGELFDDRCCADHNGDGFDACGGEKVSAPTVALVLKWLRDVKGCLCGVCYSATKKDVKRNWFYSVVNNGDEKWAEGFSSYEEAESALTETLVVILEKGGVK